MKSKEVENAFGGLSKLRAIVEKISNDRGVSVIASPCINEENPEDNWMNILFEFPSEKICQFIRAAEDVDMKLIRKGLSLSYECCGDGKDGTLMSYRVSKFSKRALR